MVKETSMNVLILSNTFDPHGVKASLAPDFPELNFWAVAEEADVGDRIEETDVLITVRISDDLLSRAKNLKWIQAMIAGTERIEGLKSLKARKDILLTSARGIHGPQMSEMAIMLMIALTKQFPLVLRNQERRVWESWPSPILAGKTVGILAVGTIGKAIAKKCRAFDMTVLGVGPHPREEEDIDRFYSLDDLHFVLSQADYFIAVAPSKPDNQNLMNAQAFSKMKSTSFFINMGRGELVDENALLQTLKARGIAGAALDCFKQEPLPKEHPFWGLDNLILTPHIGGVSDVYVQQAARIIRKNIKRFLEGDQENMINIVPRTDSR